MAEAASTGKSGKVVIRNIGLLLSGDIDKPILDADTLVVNDGLIVAVGKAKDCDVGHAQTVIDAHQTCVCPGLIDSHVHPVFGDWTPRQNQIGRFDSTLLGGPSIPGSGLNKDPEARIFRIAGYGLEADLFSAMPELANAL